MIVRGLGVQQCFRGFFAGLGMLVLVSCTGVPQGVTPVSGFELEQYLGQWFEVARLDNRFEAGLSEVTANYTLRDDGGIDVLNRGFDKASGSWRQAKGRAYFVGDSQTGHLKVSFFGPIFSSYVVFGLDKVNYNYAFVSGYNRDFLWLLSRSPEVSDSVRHAFETQAALLGFDSTKLHYIEHKQVE